MKRSRAPSRLHAVTAKVQKTTASTLPRATPTTTARAPAKKGAAPLHRAAVKPTVSKATSQSSDDQELFLVFEVFWTKRSSKKNKTYSDGILVIRGRKCSLRDMEGKEIGKTQSYSPSTLSDLKEGNTLEVGAKELEIIRPASTDDFTSGRIFGDDAKKPTTTPVVRVRATSIKKTPKNSTPKAKYDENTEGAVVLYRAQGAHDEQGAPHCSVVVDPYIGKHLRPHQIEGVKFLFECCTGLRNEGWNGCILADAMGLGKTLQSITLLYTLLQQSRHGGSTIKKAMIVCPSSLVDNWKKEINRWLGLRLKPLTIGGDSNKKEVKETVVSFVQSSINNVLIISYGYFKRNVKELQKSTVDLILCDEGHKLKSGTAQITKALHSMPTKRRVILSGTPIQNDLQEFFYILDVVNPGVMGSIAAFRRVYEKPINQSRERNCKPSQREEGDARAAELSRKCNMFILRRKADILIPYLPPKVELVVFCRLSDVQVKLYNFFLKSRNFLAEIMESMSFAFACIQRMSKLCNHPALIYEKLASEFPDALSLFSEDFDPMLCQPEYSGKVLALDRLLKIVRQSSKEDKVVVVSNYTKTLDLLEKLFHKSGYSFLRLDGSTDSAKRMKLVERFNSKHSPEFIFLLSSKAGGVGLNLIGGNRLVLLDPDWNPATDEQAMARIWREGQPKPVWIYRFISTGTIEEKIYQRQMRKQALSRSIVDESLGEKRNFTSDELKRLFNLNLDTDSETHQLLGCDCADDGTVENDKRGDLAATLGEDDGWKHFKSLTQAPDPAISRMDNQFESELVPHDNLISFVFAHQTKDLSDLPVRVTEVEEDDKSYIGYESDDFVESRAAKTKKRAPAKQTEVKPKKAPARATRSKAKAPPKDCLVDEEDDEMADLLLFVNEDEDEEE